MAAVPGTGAADDVYFIVKRTINGVTKRFVEIFDYTDIDTTYADAAVFYLGAATSTITGLTHLEGMTVSVIADGVVHPDVVVSSGTITLQYPASNVIVGLGYTTTVELLNPEFGDMNSSSQGRQISIQEVVLRFKDTINCKVGGVVLPFRTNTMGLDSAIPPYTGDISLNRIGWRKTDNVVITSDTPTPFTLLGVITKGAVNT